VTTYYDTGVLVKLWVREILSDEVADFVTQRGEVIPYTFLHEIEIKNALRLKVFRREIVPKVVATAIVAIDEDLRLRRLVEAAPSWQEVFMRCGQISATSTEKIGCRSLDLLHVAAALVLGCDEIVSLDNRQLSAAQVAGLRATRI